MKFPVRRLLPSYTTTTVVLSKLTIHLKTICVAVLLLRVWHDEDMLDFPIVNNVRFEPHCHENPAPKGLIGGRSSVGLGVTWVTPVSWCDDMIAA
jgi:hypothetical protein